MWFSLVCSERSLVRVQAKLELVTYIPGWRNLLGNASNPKPEFALLDLSVTCRLQVVAEKGISNIPPLTSACFTFTPGRSENWALTILENKYSTFFGLLYSSLEKVCEWMSDWVKWDERGWSSKKYFLPRKVKWWKIAGITISNFQVENRHLHFLSWIRHQLWVGHLSLRQIAGLTGSESGQWQWGWDIFAAEPLFIRSLVVEKVANFPSIWGANVNKLCYLYGREN